MSRHTPRAPFTGWPWLGLLVSAAVYVVASLFVVFCKIMVMIGAQ